MAEPLEELPQGDEDPADAPARPSRAGRRWRMAAGVSGGLMLVGLGVIWLNRDVIADNVIAGQIRDMGLKGTYRIRSIGPQMQVVDNIVIGDPAHPDLTIERAEVEIGLRFGLPSLGRVTLRHPRLYGRYRGGKLSFGSLDAYLFKPSTTPFRLPDLDLALVDGRARLLTDHGDIGAKIEGSGQLRSGFSGVAALIAPRLDMAGCKAGGASLFGKLSVTDEKPRLAGPLRLDSLNCPHGGLKWHRAAIALDATFDQPLNGATATLSLASGGLDFGARHADGLDGKALVTWRKSALTAQYELTGRKIASDEAGAASLTLRGMLRAPGSFAAAQLDGTVEGQGVSPGKLIDAPLKAAEQAGKDSLIAPLLAQLRGVLARQGRSSHVSGDYVLRQTGGVTNLVMPKASLHGGNGETLLAVSRLQLVAGGGGPLRLAGNFTVQGAGMPRITGRMDRDGHGATRVRMTMAEYRAGSARLALPELVVAQTANGAIGVSGRAIMSGAIPGGSVQDLELPLDGNRSPRGVLALWRGCRLARFAGLTYANLVLDRGALTLCPGPGGAIVRSGGRGLLVNVGTPALALAGRLGSSPIRIASGPVGFALPGAVHAGKLDVELGPVAKPTHFRVADLTADLTGRQGKGVTGTFSGTDALISAVPLDVLGAAGQWRFADGRLEIGGASFRLEDRLQADRFQPLISRDAALVLEGDKLTANAVLREPASDRDVAHVSLAHDLASGTGHADLAVPGINFDSQLQPDTLSRLALGVVANARGTVTGLGRIDWTDSRVTSTGKFSTTGVDFAAAFGPVAGVAGTVEFSDLLGLVTRPDQRLKIATINPGIAVEDGELSFEMRPDSVLMINGASWPFLDGNMTLLPTRMVLGASEVRRYELKVEGISAGKFIEKMELANLSATGSFDGSLPLVFDQNGGRIEGGILTARPPGGNVSYVGALTYKNLGAMANFAFESLRSLDFKQMRIAMDGDLEGELVTRVRFDGVTQGEGAKRNLITRQLGHLPIRFNINIHAPFYQLITSFKTMYAPEYIRDPRAMGLLDANGQPVRAGQPNGAPMKNTNAPKGVIQPPVSEKKP